MFFTVLWQIGLCPWGWGETDQIIPHTPIIVMAMSPCANLYPGMMCGNEIIGSCMNYQLQTHDFTYIDLTYICFKYAHGHFMNYSPSLETLLLICSDRESSSLARAGADSDSCGDKRNICRLFNLIQPHFQTKCPPPHPLFRDNN